VHIGVGNSRIFPFGTAVSEISVALGGGRLAIPGKGFLAPSHLSHCDLEYNPKPVVVALPSGSKEFPAGALVRFVVKELGGTGSLNDRVTGQPLGDDMRLTPEMQPIYSLQ
jgi:hypothetical protein